MSENLESKFKAFLKQITYEQIRLDFDSATFYKGLKYYEQDRVSDVAIEGLNTLTARVYGRSKYIISLKLSGDALQDHCSCPVGGGCKHVVAALLYCVDKPEEMNELNSVPASMNKETVEHFLQSLSKKELIGLVLKFAPGSFKEYITLSTLGKDQSNKLFKNVLSKIESLYEDDDLLYDPGSFEDSLVVLLEKLKGIWMQLPGETGDLIISIMEKLNDLMDEGYLYDDYYDSFFVGADFSRIVREYIYSLPLDGKMSFIERMDKTLSEMECDNCDGILKSIEELFSDEDKPFVKTYFLNEIPKGNHKYVEDYYKLLSDHLTSDEKELVLRAAYLESIYLTLELTNLFKTRKDADAAIQVLESFLSNQIGNMGGTEDLYITLLQLKKESGYPLEETALEALNHHSSIHLLEMVAGLVPEKQSAFEHIIREKAAHKYLEYLEMHQRLKEAVQFVEQSKRLYDEDKSRFFLKYLNDFPKEAEVYFMKRIDQELPHTCDRHYYVIAEALSAIKKIDPGKALAIAHHIRREYKRRRNLMKAIENI